MDAGPRRGPHLISGATTRPWPSPRPAALPGAGRCSRGGTCLQPGRGPLKLNLDLSAGTRQGAQGRQRKGRCLDFLPPSPRPSRQEKFSRLGQACPLHPGGAGLEALGSVARSWVQGTVGKEIRHLLFTAGIHETVTGPRLFTDPETTHLPKTDNVGTISTSLCLSSRGRKLRGDESSNIINF